MKPSYLVHENKAYEKWIRSKECLICQKEGVHGHHVDHARRNSFMLVPLCHAHHTFSEDAYHVLERQRFEDHHKINLDWEIMRFLMEYIQEAENE